jgi:hypothetical protein
LLYYEGEDDSIDASYNSTTGTTTDPARTSLINNNRVHDNGMISSSQRHAATSHNNQPNWYFNGCNDAQEALRLKGIPIDKVNCRVALL